MITHESRLLKVVLDDMRIMSSHIQNSYLENLCNLKTRIHSLKLFLLLCLTLTVFLTSITPSLAQDDNSLNGTLTIDKNAKIELGTANRNFEKINNIQPSQPQKTIDYKVQDVELVLPKLDTKVKAVTTSVPDLTKFYGDYLKVGFGNYTSPYLEGFVNNKRSEKYSYGTHVKYFASKNGPVKNSGLNEELLEGYGKYFGAKTVLRGNISYQRNRYNYYGYNHATRPNAGGDSLKQVFNTFTISGGIENKNKQDKFNYNTDVNYYNFSTYKNAKEGEFLWNYKADYWLDNSKTVIVDGALSSSKRTDSTSIQRTLFSIKPAIHYKYNDKLNLIGGINVAYANDTIKDYHKLHVYPRINIEYKVFDTKVIVYGGLDGEMQKNTLRTLSRENSYLGSNIALFHTNKTSDFYAGIKGGLKGGISYKLKLSSANYRYLYFFNNSVTDTSKFSVLYDKGNVNVLNFGGELGYEMTGSFRLAIASYYYKYTMSQLEKPWQRPDFTTSVLATYNLNKKVHFNVDFYYIGGLAGKNFVTGREVQMKGIADLDLKVDYLVSNKFSIFVEVNNILSQKYQRYLYYYNKGINILAGLTYSF
ncbi:MAG TPA: hypothetical protein VK766_02145 [Cytophagaceae bacterium]|jgi:hypothetical protein|nr:hypothetical protein [Cytophagaceae bacterium]